MNSKQARVFNAVRRVQIFLDANNTVPGLDMINKSDTRKQLDDAATQLGSYAGDQVAGKVNAMGETSNQRALRLALRANHMNPIVTIAKAKLKDVPQFSSLTMPPSSASGKNNVVAAGGMAQAAQQYAQVFVSAGLAPDFVDTLRAAAAAVQASIETRATSLGQKTGATGGLKDADTRARNAIKVLNSVVVPALMAKDGFSAQLAEWKSIHKITAKLGPAVGTLQAVRATALAAPAVPPAPTPPAAAA